MRCWRSTSFQPTLPARGATIEIIIFDEFIPISTHAPRTGSDSLISTASKATNTFQPTLPARGATSDRFFRILIRGHFNPRSPHGERPVSRGLSGVIHRQFQPTLPARGATVLDALVAQVRPISTHAPRTGSDHVDVNHDLSSFYFNPRSPHGERPVIFAGTWRLRKFQPTLPARGATIVV